MLAGNALGLRNDAYISSCGFAKCCLRVKKLQQFWIVHSLAMIQATLPITFLNTPLTVPNSVTTFPFFGLLELQHFIVENTWRALFKKNPRKRKGERSLLNSPTPFQLAAWILSSPWLDFFEVSVRAALHGWFSGWGREVRKALHWINKNPFVNYRATDKAMAYVRQPTQKVRFFWNWKQGNRETPPTTLHNFVLCLLSYSLLMHQLWKPCETCHD